MGIKIMRKNFFLAVSVCFFCVSALQAMEEDKPKASTLYNRAQRDYYLEQGDYNNAASFAIKVINETPEAEDNSDATVEDFRKARDICGRVPHYLSDATSYAEGIRHDFENEETREDLEIARDLYVSQGWDQMADHYNNLLRENAFMRNKK